MIRVYSVAGFLSKANKERINAVCSEYGYEITYFGSNDEADGRVSDGEIIYCTNPALLGQMKGLRWVHTANAGVDSFVRSGLFDSGSIVLTNSSGAYGRAISEHIIMVTLMLMRRIPEYEKIIDEREWRQHLPIRSIAGSNIVIIGTGDLGSTAAAKFRALGAARITGFNRTGRHADNFDEIFRIAEFREHVADADVVVMCVPGTPETDGLMSAERIAAIPETAYLVNVGRGTTVDQDALISALNEGRLAGAALDVVYPEPLPQDHPLWTAANCILTPHVSGDMGLGYTVDVTVDYFCENLRRYAEGRELINRIDPSIGY